MKTPGLSVLRCGKSIAGWAGLVTTLLSVASVVTSSGAGAGDGPPMLTSLAGNTLSVVTWVPRSAATPGGGALSRFLLQAYLRQDGSASIRVWDGVRNAYTKPVERYWTLSGSKLCLDVPPPGPGGICADVHSWGPRIVGFGTAPYVMLDGDLKRGNALIGAR